MAEITNRSRAVQTAQALAAQGRYSRLRQRLMLAEEAERKEISVQLHESVGQMVTVLLIELSLLRDATASGDVAIYDSVLALSELTTAIHNDVRYISHLLRPPAIDIVGLGASLHSLCDFYARLSGIEVIYHGPDTLRLSEAITIIFYRFVQEALKNAIRHSRASQVSVDVFCGEKWFSITVEDDGVGFDAHSVQKDPKEGNGLGLLAIRERLHLVGANLRIQSTADVGSRLTASCRLSLGS